MSEIQLKLEEKYAILNGVRFNTYIELIIRAKRINRYQPQPTNKL